jgi:iron complex transport system ATP-binding protein
MSNIIEVENLGFSFTGKPVLQNLCFTVTEGSFVCIIGPNGAGKTTLLNLISGIIKSESGSIKLQGRPVESYSTRNIAHKIAVVRQEFVPAFDFTVNDIVSMARTPYLGMFGMLGRGDVEIINDSLEATEMTGFADRILSSLSAGERQRVFIARALAQNTPVLLLDEPTTFLDMKHQVGIYDLLKTSQIDKGKTIIAITHDINLAVQYCEKILFFAADGSYQFGTPDEILSAEQIRKNFGVNVYTGSIGKKNFFIPLSRFTKDDNEKSDK